MFRACLETKNIVIKNNTSVHRRIEVLLYKDEISDYFIQICFLQFGLGLR